MKNRYKIGTDIVEVKRIERLLNLYNERFFDHIYTNKEVKWCKSRMHPSIHFAGRFAAKEALKKALLSYGEDFISFKSIEILRELNYPPYVNLNISNSHLYSCEISISHTSSYATAMAIIKK